MTSVAGPYRELLIGVLSTLASGEELLAYERRVSIAYVPDELNCQFFDDHFHPKSEDFIREFSEAELKEIAIFSGYFRIASDEVEANGSPPVAQVLKLPRWREMMRYASKTANVLRSL